MLPQVRLVPLDIAPQSILNHPRCKMLRDRAQYRSCHIRVPDSQDRLAAIKVHDRYYSFFKLIEEEQKALQIAAKLVYRGDEVAMTLTVKGVAIWVYEAEASSPKPSKVAKQTGSRLWRILTSQQEYQRCEISVPDGTQALTAICWNQRYYSLLRMVREELQAIELAERLSSKGHDAIITRNDCGYEVWVLEADATLHA